MGIYPHVKIIRRETRAVGGRYQREEVVKEDHTVRHTRTTERTGFHRTSHDTLSSQHLSRDIDIPLTRYSSYGYINDGIIEKISEKVFAEYVRRSPFYDKGLDRNVQPDDFLSFDALPQKVFFNLLIEKIAKESGLPEETVENAFIGAYFRGDNLESREIAEMLNEAVGKNFDKKIRINSDEYKIHIARLFMAILDRETMKGKILAFWERVKGNAKKHADSIREENEKETTGV